MVRSMTGFGRGQINDCGYTVNCEIKGVNHRYFDPFIRISRRYSLLEDRIKEELRKYVSRGRLEININIEKSGESKRNIKVDKDLAIAYYNYLKELAEKLNISQEIRIIDLFRLPEVFSLEDEEEDIEIVWAVLRQSLDVAMDCLVDMRVKEGLNLAEDIRSRNRGILKMVEQLETRSPQVSLEHGERMRTRISEFMEQDVADQQRLLQEIAIFAEKSNITEEIVRLKSHSQHLEELMHAEDAVGRKSDFLVQEMFREINTIASKANDLEMNRIVVEVKAELEKIREQLQNIE
ncbi:MAG: YicC family protein [Syntrophomonadaceae bacterium]|nr:YicC family protein [Syntrophomonadaceae bacterium]